MKLHYHLALACLLALPIHGHCQAQESAPDFPPAMLDTNVAHDIAPALLGRFWENPDWKSVTTRWRQDNRELRFIYANRIAWEAMAQGKNDYPKGAVLAKMGIQAMEDPLFPNSLIPSRTVNRVQVMLKDPSHPKAASDGWVYALYIPPKPDGVMQEKDIQSCAECHAKAKARGGVFSQPLILGRRESEKPVSTPAEGDFKKATVAEAPDLLRPWLPKEVPDSAETFIDWTTLFNGAVNEYTPVVAKMAAAAQAIHAVFDDRSQLYLIGYPTLHNGNRCAVVIASRVTGFDPSSGGPLFGQDHNLFCGNDLVERRSVSRPPIPPAKASGYPKAANTGQ